ncbi:MAG: flagellin [Halocynthiibacter sp.]
MIGNGFGDGVLNFQLASQNKRLNKMLATASNELASGQVEQPSKVLDGDFVILGGIEARLRQQNAFTFANKEAALFASSMQTALGTLHQSVSDVGVTLLDASSAGYVGLNGGVTAGARQQFDAAVAGLNTVVAGRSLFSGQNANPPLITGEAMLGHLNGVVSGLTNASDVAAAVHTWFSDPLGFDALAYQGGAAANNTPIGAGQSVDLSILATDEAIKETLKGLALASLAHEGVLSASPDEHMLLLKEAGQNLLSAEGGIANLRAEIGVAEARIEQVSLQIKTETDLLTLHKTELLRADPYEAAVRLKEVETQLELLYTTTARSSKLSLVNFL